ncbi:MAG: hypothetical protein NTV11_04740 [Rhodocyclales bacterium]|nr:hypothetical protein [Rhodocyclales bacterium]
MNLGHGISAQANKSEANVKPRSGGRSQNYMPPEAAAALKQAQMNQGVAEAKPAIDQAPKKP